ncbi:MAG: hypothetical protein AAFY76_01010 [Cyanobacteria bacterium J06649_11]
MYNANLDRQQLLEQHMHLLPTDAQIEVKSLLSDYSQLYSLFGGDDGWDLRILGVVSKCFVSYMSTDEFRHKCDPKAEEEITVLSLFIDSIGTTLQYARNRFYQ